MAIHPIFIEIFISGPKWLKGYNSIELGQISWTIQTVKSGEKRKFVFAYFKCSMWCDFLLSSDNYSFRHVQISQSCSQWDQHHQYCHS